MTGTLCAGKDTFANYLVALGFKHVSLSDILREELTKRSIEITRESMQLWGNTLRKELGGGFLAAKALERMKEDKRYVVTSVRSVLEVKELYANKNFVLIHIDAPIETRFNRLLARGKDRKEDKETTTFDKFIESESKELTSPHEYNQQLLECKKLAKLSLSNDGDTRAFYGTINKSLPKMVELSLM